MSVPVTTRLDESTVEAVDRAVAYSEEAILASYRHRYSNPDPEHDALIAELAAFSARACLPDES